MITSLRAFEKYVCRVKCAIAQGRQAGWVLWIYKEPNPATGNSLLTTSSDVRSECFDRQRFGLNDRMDVSGEIADTWGVVPRSASI
jgi:hypothetical protein